MTKFNLLFIFIFLNIWDFAINRAFFNGMIFGLGMFGPSTLLWFIGTVRAAALMTIISFFEFIMMSVFVIDGFQLGGLSAGSKSIFWIPYLVVAGVNGFLGLQIYSAYRKQKMSRVGKRSKKAVRVGEEVV